MFGLFYRCIMGGMNMIRHVCEMKMLRKFNCNVKQLSFNDTYAD